MVKKLFLTSSVHAVAKDIAARIKNLHLRNKLVFIDTPAEAKEGNKEWLKNDRKALVEAGFDLTDYTITGKTQRQLKADLQSYDYIYGSGGDTLYFLKKAQESGFVELIRDYVINKGKTYIGTSGGSVIAGPRPHEYYLEEGDVGYLKDTTGFNLVNFLVVPHWGRDDFREKYLDGRLRIAYKEDQLPLILLTDYQYVEVIGEQIIVHDVNKRF